MIKGWEMTELFKTTLNYSNSGKADWLRKVDWYSIPIREIAGIEGKKQARYCPLENVIELAPDDNFPVLFGSFIHELYHASQRRRFGLLLYWLFLGLFRPLMERGAKEAELAAVEWANEIQIQQWRENIWKRKSKV